MNASASAPHPQRDGQEEAELSAEQLCLRNHSVISGMKCHPTSHELPACVDFGFPSELFTLVGYCDAAIRSVVIRGE